MDNLAGYIDESLCLDYRQIVLWSSWVLVLGRWAGVCKLEQAEACWMGETWADVSDSNQTPQMRKTFWTAIHKTLVLCMYECTCVSKGWIWDVTALSLWRNPSRLPPPNKSSGTPNKQKNILTFHSLILYQKITFPSTVRKQYVL